VNEMYPLPISTGVTMMIVSP